MNVEVMKQILNKIKEYDRIMLFRHVRNDGDCVGATKGFKAILKLTWPEKEVYLIDSDTAAYLEFMGPEDNEVADEIYESALGIVLEVLIGVSIYILAYLWKRDLVMVFIGASISTIYLLIVELFVEHEFKPALMYDAYAVCIVLYLLNII